MMIIEQRYIKLTKNSMLMQVQSGLVFKHIRGFSYIELVISITILALLATVAVPYLESTVKRHKESELKGDLRDIRLAIDAYKKAYNEGHMLQVVGESGYPKRLEDLVIGIPDLTDPGKKLLRFMRKLPADPMFLGSYESPSETWGKRSYESDAESPREGVDVYDIYSLSEEKGLNGSFYRQW
jgi:general secretion pathway protein G